MINYLDIQKQLQLNGWFLKKSEIETLYREHDNLDVKKIIQLCLNIDLRDIQELDVKGKLDSLNSDVVLQIQKIRNVGAPKDNPESKTAPRLFKLQLTDGNSTYSAIEAETIQAFTMNTAPGTKILLKLKSSSIETSNGQLLLKPSNCSVLGGHVSHLVEKWELTRSLAKYAKGARIGGVNGPPPFIAFGEKIQQNVPVANDKSFKSLQNNNGKENENENSEFNAQRNDAIAEAYKSGTKKTFGGGTNKLIDSNVQKIMEKGYTEEQANQALKFSRNNLEKALNNLKRHDDKTRSHNAQKAYDSDSSRTTSKDVAGKRSGKAAAASEPPTTKPSAKVSLFEFLEDKLPQHEYENATAKNSTYGSYNNGGNPTGNSNKYSSSKPSYSNQERFENNISSSFRKNDRETNHVSKGSSSAPSASKSQQLPSSSSAGTSTSQNANNSNNRNSNLGGNAQNSNYSRDNRESREGSSKYYNQYNSGYQSSNSAPYRQKNNNYSSSSQQDQRKQPQQQSHYSQNKYSQGNQGGANYQRGKPNPSYQKNESKYDSKYESKYDSKYESKYDSRYDSKYDKKYDQKYDQKYDSGKYDYNSGKPNYNSSNQNYGGMYNNRGNYSNQSGSSKYYDSKNEQQSSNSHVNNKGRTQQVTDSMAKLNLNKPTTPQAQPATNVQGPSSHKTTYNAGMSNGSKNSINKNRESQPQSQVNATVDVNAKNSTFGNDFAKMNYNPYQIIGFQNKETNEYAKNVLKNQQQQQPPQQQSSGPAPATTIYHIPAGSVQTTNAPPPPFVQNHQVAVMPPMTTVIPTQGPTVYHSNYPIMMQAPPIPTGPLPTQPNAALINGKAGEFCLAKYWEDGQFYNAKITGVSDNTYVVLFTDYGNHEEVRKSDCLPLITTPISSAPSPHPPTFQYQPSFHPIQLHPQPAGPIQTGKSGQIHHNNNKMVYQPMGLHSSQRNNGSNGNGNGNKIHRYNVSKN